MKSNSNWLTTGKLEQRALEIWDAEDEDKLHWSWELLEEVRWLTEYESWAEVAAMQDDVSAALERLEVMQERDKHNGDGFMATHQLIEALDLLWWRGEDDPFCDDSKYDAWKDNRLTEV